jgi:hypothetical protein
MALAVRLALLVSSMFDSLTATQYSQFDEQREVFHKDPSNSYWKSVDETLAAVRLKAASADGLNVSE